MHAHATLRLRPGCACGPTRVRRAAPPRAQEFHNYNPATDIFCHSNRLFWDVTCPGIVDGFGGVMCTGTNYVVRSRALLKARPGRMLCSAARCVRPRAAACLPHRVPMSGGHRSNVTLFWRRLGASFGALPPGSLV